MGTEFTLGIVTVNVKGQVDWLRVCTSINSDYICKRVSRDKHVNCWTEES